MAQVKRPVIILECTNCHHRNYATEKNVQKTPEKLELRKFCPFCRKHQVHKEVKV